MVIRQYYGDRAFCLPRFGHGRTLALREASRGISRYRNSAPEHPFLAKSDPQEATFYLRGKKIDRDPKPPIRVGLKHASSGEKLEAVASSLDGRKVSLTRKLLGC